MEIITKLVDTEVTTELIKTASDKKCPECGSENLSKNGMYRNIQQYICKECDHTFRFVQNKSRSKLMPHIEFIREARVKEMSLSEIKDQLWVDHQIDVTRQAIDQFIKKHC